MEKKTESTRSQLTRLFFTGVTMGAADIVPGVSGGTIAFIFGIYEELLLSIKKVTGEVLRLFFSLKFKQAVQEIPFSFLVPLGLGIGTALFSLANLIDYLLSNQPVYIWSFFFGLVLASIYLVIIRIKNWELSKIVALLASTGAAYLIVGMVPTQTPDTLWTYFLSGAIAICAMILPGISGSFLLLIMGKYQQVLNAVQDFDIVILSVFMLGCILGISFFARFLSWLFAKHHDLTIAILTGFMVGSLRKVWPWKQVLQYTQDSHGELIPLVEKNIVPTSAISLIIALMLALSAAAIIMYLNKLQITKEHHEDINEK